MIRGINYMRKLFAYGSVQICGQRGRGKDMLMANVACRSRCYYGNVNYGGNYRPLDFSALDTQNSFHDLINGSIKRYVYPYEEGADIYISDIGIYFPSQYNGELDKKYPRLPQFLCLSRQLGSCNVHLNTQSLARCWLKFREQSDCYILCQRIFKPLIKLGVVIQKVTLYSDYESCARRVVPFCLPKPTILSPKEVKLNYEIEKQRYLQNYGEVKNVWLIYRQKSTYDTRYFKTLLEA
jgi:hypothetical protein